MASWAMGGRAESACSRSAAAVGCALAGVIAACAGENGGAESQRDAHSPGHGGRDDDRGINDCRHEHHADVGAHHDEAACDH